MSLTKPLLVSVCIATYRRAGLLGELLESLAQQQLDQDFSIELIVVDNDPDRSAESVVMNFQLNHQIPTNYSVETARNLSTVRNQSVRLANGDFVAFIDDDEVAEPCWLKELLAVLEKCKADVVSGPVIPVYSDSIPVWMQRGGFFERRRLITGSEIEFAGTGNVLMRVEKMRELNGPFDPVYGQTGGEDTNFFYRLKKSGAKIVWANEAVVMEIVPLARATIRYITRRSYRGGQIYASIMLPDWTILQKIAWMLYRLLIVLMACLLLPISWLAGRIAGMKALQKFASNLGQLSVLVKHRVKEYQ
ncbi:MAG: glycosyltransferase [Candidatus Thiodiazotropha endolucinida]